MSGYNYLPTKKTKTNVFSVRMTDDEHQALLAVAAAEGECRAVTLVDLAKKGLELYCREHGIGSGEITLTKILEERGIVSSQD